MRTKFEIFLKENGKSNKTIKAYIDNYLQTKVLFINSKSLWDTVVDLMQNGFSVHALSLCDIKIQYLVEKISNFDETIEKEKKLKGSYQSYKTAIQWLKRFIDVYFTLLNYNAPSFVPIHNLNVIVPQKMLKIDGMEIFLSREMRTTIKNAIESIIFLSPEIIISQHDVIVDQFSNNSKNKKIPVRDSSNVHNGCYQIKSNTYYVFTGHDGNKPVRDIIKNHTGYIVADGKRSFLYHYVISHVWSNARDPRYFTSMWNIALVPTWLNPVMDKESTQGSIATIIKETVRAICKKLYFKSIGSKGFHEIEIDKSPAVSKRIKRDEYNILILNPRMKGEDYGRFSRRPVTV